MADSALKEDALKENASKTDAAKVLPEQPNPEDSLVNAKVAENQAAIATAPVNGIEIPAQPKEAPPVLPKTEEKKVDSTPSAVDPPLSVPSPSDAPAASSVEPISHASAVELVPDPDEDDLDDLDGKPPPKQAPTTPHRKRKKRNSTNLPSPNPTDVLDEFAATKLDSQPTPPA